MYIVRAKPDNLLGGHQVAISPIDPFVFPNTTYPGKLPYQGPYQGLRM